MTDKPSQVTIVILTKDSEKTIKKCLESARWAEIIMVLDDNSTDRTLEICQSFTSHCFVTNQPDFAAKRNEALSKTKTDWILYIDSDEIISPQLAAAVQKIITHNQPAAYQIKRENYFLGKKMYPDYVDRLFHKHIIQGWQGVVHESPVLKQTAITIEQPLIHHTHTNITSMLAKTNHWSEFEADLRIKAHHPPVAWWRIMRIIATECWHQLVVKRILRYGRAGLFEGYFQIVDKIIVYTKLWEKQQS